MKPTLCILNYNGEGILPVALTAACAIRDRFARIVVIDNGSQDGSLGLIRRDFAGVEVLEVGQNLGAAGGRNAGLQRLPEDLLLFIDNDVALTAACVDRLVEALAARPDASIAVPAVLYADQRDTVQYGGAECHFLGMQILVNENVPIAQVDPATKDMGSLVSCCFLVDRSRLPRGEVFDESYFIYFEDHEYGVRLRALGSGLIAVPSAQCFHGRGTEGLSIRQLGSYSSRRVFYLIRNRWLFLLKIYSPRTLLVFAPLALVYEFAQFFGVLRKGWLREWWRAVTWIFSHLPDVLAERRRVQRLRRRPDRDLIRGGAIPFRSELVKNKLERIGLTALGAVASAYWRVVGWLV